MCCSQPCLVRVYLDGSWYMKCLNCDTHIPE